ncbi:MAG: RagB/SusD family nutrient uptake outer membrane protein [Bacteroidales bacterium]|jgi:hypothetical protein|nr:RagB/SusD family nutrient uptake outer membrane protein [Bacteroidales bacterium]
MTPKKYITRKIMMPLMAFSLTGTLVLSPSCHFLDIDPYITDLFTLDTVFAKRAYAQRYLFNIYSYLIDDGSQIANQGRAQPWVAITDEALFTYNSSSHSYNYFANNRILSDNIYTFNRWTEFYEGIRKATTFIRRIQECEEATDMERSQWTGEALFVKAMLYFELMKEWGPVPIVPDEPVNFDTPLDELLLGRSTWDECSDYVSGLLKEAIRLLPPSYMNDLEVGKPLKISALAVLSRLTLYTASPLFNGDNNEFAGFGNETGPYLNPEKKIEKWAIAAAVAKQLVTEKPNDLHTVTKMANTPRFPVPEAEQANFPDGVGGIDPYHSYSDMFTGVTQQVSTNKECLFSRQVTRMNDAARYTAPRVINGWGDFSLTQALVDAYYMADGRSITDAEYPYAYETGYTNRDSTFSGQPNMDGFTILNNTYKWYVNREMRFYASVTYNNSLFSSTTSPANQINPRDGRVAKFYSNSQSGKEWAQSIASCEPEDYPMTGYLCRKFISYEDSWFSGARQTPKYALVYRMAEIYLNYVEAMNELGNETFEIEGVTVFRDPVEMKRCFNLVRYRAGLPGITDADVANVEKMRELILRERQIEFAWEGHRYFDLRRNKKAIIYENAPVMGCNVNATEAAGDNFYSISRVTERNYTYKVFTMRQTFFPIPKTEVDKNRNLDQLPGY